MPAKKRSDGQTTFGEIAPGTKFIKLQGNDKVVRDNQYSTGVEVYVKLWKPTTWTKKYGGKLRVVTEYPTALNLYNGTPAHIQDDQEVQILY